MTEHFFHIDDLTQGLARKLTNGITTRIFPGDQAMLSVVRIAPNAQGTLHSHPEEQWGYMIEGSATRIQNGEHIQVEKGSFWRTPGMLNTVLLQVLKAVSFWMFLPRQEKNIKLPARVLGRQKTEAILT